MIAWKPWLAQRVADSRRQRGGKSWPIPETLEAQVGEIVQWLKARKVRYEIAKNTLGAGLVLVIPQQPGGRRENRRDAESAEGQEGGKARTREGRK